MKRNIEMFRGDTKILQGQLTTPQDDLPIDLTDVSMWFTAKTKKTDADPGVFQKTLGAGISFPDPTDGRFIIVISSEDTQGLEEGRYVYDIQIKNGLDQIFTVIEGTLKIVLDVTNAT